MATDLTYNNQDRDRFQQAKVNINNFEAAKTPFLSVYNALSNAQKNAALQAITNWNFNASSPTVARENALFVAVALLYVVGWYLAKKAKL